MTDLVNGKVEGNVLAGPLRTPRNGAQNIKGSIHDDETAQKLGLRGGTVAGSVHLDLFPPLLLELFGQRWFEHGSISMNFKNPTVDREAVRAFVERPAAGATDVQVNAWIDRDDGMRVGEGTVAVGAPTEPTALRAIDHGRFSAGEFRILDGVTAGDEIPDTEITVDGARQRQIALADTIDWYSGDSPWGGPIASLQTAVHNLYTFAANHIGRTVTKRGGGVGLFGAIEIANLSRPLLLDETYRMNGRVLAVGQSPKTEYVWFETTAHDLGAGTPISSMVMQLRWMKASSPLYQ